MAYLILVEYKTRPALFYACMAASMPTVIYVSIYLSMECLLDTYLLS